MKWKDIETTNSSTKQTAEEASPKNNEQFIYFIFFDDRKILKPQNHQEDSVRTA